MGCPSAGSSFIVAQRIQERKTEVINFKGEILFLFLFQTILETQERLHQAMKCVSLHDHAGEIFV